MRSTPTITATIATTKSPTGSGLLISVPFGYAACGTSGGFSIPLECTSGYDDRDACASRTEGVMRVFAVLIAATAIFLGAHDVALVQTTVPSVAPPLTGLGSTPVTSTVTNCMMSCNSQAASCQTGCVMPATPTTAGSAGATQTGTLNATNSTSCAIGCSSTQLTCQTACSRLSSQIGQ
jgi:hypothetical protein